MRQEYLKQDSNNSLKQFQLFLIINFWKKADTNNKTPNKINLVFKLKFGYFAQYLKIYITDSFFLISNFKNAGIILLISTILIKSLIPQIFLLLFRFSMCRIRHFFSEKRSFESLQSMIGRIFTIIILFLIFSIDQNNIHCHYRIKQNINEDKANYTNVGFKCKKVNFIAPFLKKMHTDPQLSFAM